MKIFIIVFFVLAIMADTKISDLVYASEEDIDKLVQFYRLSPDKMGENLQNCHGFINFKPDSQIHEQLLADKCVSILKIRLEGNEPNNDLFGHSILTKQFDNYQHDEQIRLGVDCLAHNYVRELSLLQMNNLNNIDSHNNDKNLYPESLETIDEFLSCHHNIENLNHELPAARLSQRILARYKHNISEFMSKAYFEKDDGSFEERYKNILQSLKVMLDKHEHQLEEQRNKWKEIEHEFPGFKEPPKNPKKKFSVKNMFEKIKDVIDDD